MSGVIDSASTQRTGTTTHINNNTNQEDNPVSTTTPTPQPVLGQATSFVTPRRKTKRPKNPYNLKHKTAKEDWRLYDFAQFKVFIQHIDKYITTLQQDKDRSTEAWYLLWQEWVEDYILSAESLHMVAVTVDFPTNGV